MNSDKEISLDQSEILLVANDQVTLQNSIFSYFNAETSKFDRFTTNAIMFENTLTKPLLQLIAHDNYGNEIKSFPTPSKFALHLYGDIFGDAN